ncbi:hypothetical protein PMI40_02449, partial [Herbaspirillum sp. YR522]
GAPPLPWPPGWLHLWKKSGQSPLLCYQPPTAASLRITPEL